MNDMPRVALIGDIHGNIDGFRRALAAVGCDPDSGHIPAGLWVVQLGDLVHVGADSNACIALAERMQRHDRYIQLVGNHDAAHLGAPFRSDRLRDLHHDAPWADTLRRWWGAGRLRIAVALRTRAGDVVASHAGITHGLWRHLGSPDAATCARLLNADAGAPAEALGARVRTFSGGILTGDGPNAASGPLHAATSELAGAWVHYGAHSPAPFDQVHGHAAPYKWASGQWEPEIDAAVRAHTHLDPDARHVTVDLGRGHALVGIDPGGVDPVPLTLAAEIIAS